MRSPRQEPPPATAEIPAGEPYEPPRLTNLGSVVELTAGGNVGSQSDGFGTAGAYGFLS